MAGMFGALGVRVGAMVLAALAIPAIALVKTGQPTKTPTAARPKLVLASAPAPALSTKPVPATARPAGDRIDEPFVVKRVLRIDAPFKHGDYVWDDAGVPAGPLVVTVDLAAQTMSVFRDGYEIGAAVIIYGHPDKPSPLGVFPITQKDAHHWSTLYDAAMPYMMRLTNDGVAIHGSEAVDPSHATNGCIGVPIAFAKLLFAQAKLGDRVIITDGKRLQMGEAITAA